MLIIAVSRRPASVERHGRLFAKHYAQKYSRCCKQTEQYILNFFFGPFCRNEIYGSEHEQKAGAVVAAE
jgi:hypothetical protein